MTLQLLHFSKTHPLIPTFLYTYFYRTRGEGKRENKNLDIIDKFKFQHRSHKDL